MVVQTAEVAQEVHTRLGHGEVVNIVVLACASVAEVVVVGHHVAIQVNQVQTDGIEAFCAAAVGHLHHQLAGVDVIQVLDGAHIGGGHVSNVRAVDHLQGQYIVGYIGGCRGAPIGGCPGLARDGSAAFGNARGDWREGEVNASVASHGSFLQGAGVVAQGEAAGGHIYLIAVVFADAAGGAVVVVLADHVA